MRAYLEDRRELDALLQPALDKVYGPSRSDPGPPNPDSPARHGRGTSQPAPKSSLSTLNSIVSQYYSSLPRLLFPFALIRVHPWFTLLLRFLLYQIQINGIFGSLLLILVLDPSYSPSQLSSHPPLNFLPASPIRVHSCNSCLSAFPEISPKNQTGPETVQVSVQLLVRSDTPAQSKRGSRNNSGGHRSKPVCCGCNSPTMSVAE